MSVTSDQGGGIAPRQYEVPPRPDFGQQGTPITFNAPGTGPTEELHYDRALPVYAVEDRISYFRAKQQLAQMRASQLQQMQQQAFEEELRQKLTGGAYQAIGVGEQGLAQQEQALQSVRSRSGQPLMREQARQVLESRETSITDSPFVKAANYPIPYAQRAAELVGEGLAAGNPADLFLRATGIQPENPETQASYEQAKELTREAGTTAAEFVIPQNVWQLALEFVPGIGTIPDLQRAVKAGAPDAIAALRRAEVALASERGAAQIPDIPESVTRLLAKRPKKGVVTTPEEIQARWEVLPPTYQKLVTEMADAALSPAERKLITKAGRARQTSKARQAIEETGGSTVERALAGRAAMKGRIIPEIKPIGGRFEQPEVDEIFDGIDQAFAAKTIIPQEHANATSALNLLLYGRRIPGDEDLPLHLMPYEIKLLGRIYGPEFEAALPASVKGLSAFQRAVDIANVPRAVIAGVDFSAPGRQGIVLAFRNPEKWTKSFGPMVKSWLGERSFDNFLEGLRRNPRFEDAVTHHLDLTDIGGGTAAEESFATTIARRIPIIRRSERAYVAYLNDLRMGVYGKGASRLERTAGKHGWDATRLDEAKTQWAAFVNHATGRGDLKKLNEYTPAFNAIFFSPRFVASRPQAVWDLVKPGVDPVVRQMVGENLGAFFAGGVGLLTAAGAAGAQVELDPRSTNFGKIAIPLPGGGIQTIDFWGGFQPFARYAVQASTAQRKEQFTGEMVKINRGKTLGRFLRSKLSPVGALGWDIFVEGGKTFEGDELTLTPQSIGQQALDRMTPLVFQDMIEAYQTGGLSAALTAGGVSTFGGGVSTFEPSEKQRKEAAKSGIGEKLIEAGIPDRDRSFAESEDFRKGFAETFGVPVEKVPAGYAEFRKGMIARAVKQGGLSETEATYRFDNHPFVRSVSERLSKARLAFWREHPDLLQQAIDAGIEGYSKEKGEILEGR